MLDTERLCIGCMNDSGGEKICSICGYDQTTKNNTDYLPARSWINDRYLVGRVLEHNGEGVTYIGWDNSTDSIVNIREYFPSGAARRNADRSVSITQGNEFTFNEGIMSFLELHRKLAVLDDLPCLMPTTDVFELGGTAYAVSKAVSGIPLREFLIRNGGDLKWEQARPLFLPLITTVQSMHEAGVIHRGISPDTIYVGRDGKLRLGGICTRAVRMSGSNLPIQLFPGFSAVEQYGYDVSHRDGKHTDVYGMAATLFRVLMGKAPTDVAERILNDNMQIPARYAEIIPKYVLSALANALQIMPTDRLQTIEEFRLALTPVSADYTNPFTPAPKPATAGNGHAKAVAAVPVKPAAEKTEEKKAKGSGKKYAIISSAVTAAIFIVLAIIVYFALGLGGNNGGEDNSSVSSSAPSAPPLESVVSVPAEDGEKLYQVPDLKGKRYADVISNIDYTTLFEFEVADKEFSDEYARGYIISQEQTSDQTVKKGTVIKIVVSLGPKTTTLPSSIIGKTYDEAVFELLKLGFNYDNIEKLEVYEPDSTAGVVVDVEPGVNEKYDRDIGITLRVNTYTGEEEDTSDVSSEESSSDVNSQE